MKYLLSVFVLFVFSYSLVAQQYKTSVSGSYNSEQYSTDALQLDDGTYLIISEDWGFRSQNVELAIRQLDASFKDVLKQTAEKLKIKRPAGFRLLKTGDKLFLLFQDIEKGVISDIQVSEVDPQTLAIGEPRTTCNMANFDFKIKGGMYDPGGFQSFFAISPNRENFLFLLNDRYHDEQFFLVLLDKNMKLVWQKAETLTAANSLTIQNACVDNAANAYVAYKINEGSKDPLPSKNLCNILVYNKGKKIKTLPVNPGNYYASAVKLLASGKASMIHVGGYYYANSGALLGAYAGQLSTDNLQLTSIKTEAFPPAFIDEITRDNWGAPKKSGPSVANALYPRLLELNDGTLDIIGEFHLRENNTKYVTNIAGCIVNARMNNGGAVFVRLPKYRNSAGTWLGDSFSALAIDNRVAVFYNDNPANLTKPITDPSGSATDYRHVALIAGVIEQDGSVARNVAIDLSEESFMAMTSHMIRASANTFLVQFYKVKGLGGFADDARTGEVEIQ